MRKTPGSVQIILICAAISVKRNVTTLSVMVPHGSVLRNTSLARIIVLDGMKVQSAKKENGNVLLVPGFAVKYARKMLLVLNARIISLFVLLVKASAVKSVRISPRDLPAVPRPTSLSVPVVRKHARISASDTLKTPNALIVDGFVNHPKWNAMVNAKRDQLEVSALEETSNVLPIR